MGRRALFCGNWKMHKTVAASLDLATAVRNAVAPLCQRHDIEVVVAPTFVSLHAVARRIEGSSLKLAAQDCFWGKEGAFTGEVSAHLLADIGCQYVIVGHSERRQHFGELDAMVNLKAKAVLAAEMRPIVCVGETLAEREAGETMGRLAAQLKGGLDGFDRALLERTVIAYEPVWAIGTGKVATTAQAQEAHAFIRGELQQQFGQVAQTVPILYGGSVKPDNITGLMAQPDIDGALVGGASLDAESFLGIVRYAEAETK